MSQKRSIFEDVSDTQPITTPAAGGIDARKTGARRGVRLWLVLLFVLVVAMIVVGGLTRLTDSGLSITEWRPVTGAIPPLSEADWQSEFAKYQEIPEFKDQNNWMQLSDFKTIYWWEWGHRQLGRFVGVVWFLGFVGFWLTKSIPTGWTGRLAMLGVLGGAQGAIGWWMVSSGLGAGMVDVASYRLAVHLGLAFVILGVIAWYVMWMGRSERDLMQARRGKEAKQFALATGLLHASFIQILLGALVAGIDAGRSFVDWPWMADQVFPPDAFEITPIWRNLFENAGLVQFMHRTWGYLLVIFGIVVWLRGRKSAHGRTRFAFNAVFAVMLIQLCLGIITVLYAAPLHAAITHQIVAILLWVLILRARFLAHYPIATSIREG